MNEADFQRQVIELAELLGYEHVHFRSAMKRSGRWETPVSGTLGGGFPDLVLVRERGRRIVFAELKSDRRGARLTAEQERVIDVLRLAGAEAYVWRPADLERIADILR